MFQSARLFSSSSSSISSSARRFASSNRCGGKIGVIYGDGVGEEVVSQSLRVLRKVGDWEFEFADAGFETFQKEGTALPQKTIETLSRCQGALFGAVGSPSHKVEGYKSPIIQMRNHFKLYANLRPIQSSAVPTSRENVDMLIVRENTECLYVKQETLSEDGSKAVAQRVITREASIRIAEMAFSQAKLRNKQTKNSDGNFTSSPKVTIVHKSNVLSVTDGLFRSCALEVAEKYKDVQVEEQLVDSMVYKMILDPVQYDVVVAPNLYGDILSDAGAALVGGLGLVPSLNVGDSFFIAEPVHGSAPDIAGQSIVNPIACIRSAAMICQQLGFKEEADNIERAVHKAVSEGTKTRDLGGKASTEQMTDAILHHL